VLRDGARVRVTNGSRGGILAERALVAASPLSRMRGLLGRPPLEPGEGLLLVPCRGVHTFGMTYPIDVVHLDDQGLVRLVVRRLKPWRVGPLVWGARMVLELPANSATACAGERLSLLPLEAG